MAMAVAVSPEVHVRDDFGRFIADVSGAGERTITRVLAEGEAQAVALAPSRTRPDPRTTKLKASMFALRLSRTSGIIGNTARHALHVEYGTRPHELPGDVTFFWERYWRMWMPGENIINHPGADEQPYLRPAYRYMVKRLPAIMREEYP